ncbi:TadE/TadG family type IV pilus assembly protein [Polycladidibacter stylochi]|uniref:TadE/TadG family type IV pilus assembly protein n=1 Tax=Polycladidibacter stylochi TaxID=1807766 RepID=UPI000832C254|nr:TadE/TadG family type IV pilus assembly protein [Pseudovibrio stylochi]
MYPSMKSLLSNNGGVAAVEFALVVPVLIFLLLGVVELNLLLTMDRKVSQTAATVSDLIARERKMSDSDMTNIFDSVKQVMVPYSSEGLTLNVGVVHFVESGKGDKKVIKPKTVWSVGRDGTGAPNLEPWTEGSPPTGIDIPDDIAIANSYLIIGESKYTHRPELGKFFPGGILAEIELSDVFFLQGRKVSCPEYKQKCDADMKKTGS